MCRVLMTGFAHSRLATGLSAPRVSARWEKEGHFSANDDKRKKMMLREAQAASAFNGGNPALNGLKRL